MSKGYSIRVNIGGKSFGIISDEKPDYLSDIADRVDKSISSMLFSNSSLTFEKAAVLAALKFCDDAKKCEEMTAAKPDTPKNDVENDNLRRQVIEYSKELEAVSRENKMLRKSLSNLRKEYEDKLRNTQLHM